MREKANKASPFFTLDQSKEEMSYLFTSIHMKDWDIRIFIDENNNIEKHYYPYSLQKWSKTTQRWNDITKSRQMYDTEIRNKTIIKNTISKTSLIRQLNEKHSLIKLKKRETKCFILFSLFIHNKVLQILQINGETIDYMLLTDVSIEKWQNVKMIHNKIYLSRH